MTPVEDPVGTEAADVPRILIVDDELANLEALELTLATTGCRVVRAQSADETQGTASSDVSPQLDAPSEIRIRPESEAMIALRQAGAFSGETVQFRVLTFQKRRAQDEAPKRLRRF